MAKYAITKTVGTSAVTFTKTDITDRLDAYWVVSKFDNPGVVWVNLDVVDGVALTTTAVEGDNHVPVAPGEAVPFLTLPLHMISDVAGNKITVGPR